MKILFLILALISFPAAANIPAEIVKWSKAHVFKVKVNGGSGSAFFISDTKAITACHVVDQNVVVRVFNATSSYHMVVEKCNRELDLSVLSLRAGEKVGFKASINPDQPALGLTLYAPGYPLGYRLNIGTGHAQSQYNGSIFFTTTPTMKGDSGSPVLSLVSGVIQVEGVRIAIMGTSPKMLVPHLALARSGKAINQLLGLD